MQELTEIFIEIGGLVFVVHLQLEHGQTAHPGDKTSKSPLAGSRLSNEQQMALRLAEDMFNPEDVIKEFVKEDEGDIQLFFIDFELSFDIYVGYVAPLGQQGCSSSAAWEKASWKRELASRGLPPG